MEERAQRPAQPGLMQRAAASLAKARGGLPQKLGQLMAFDGMGAAGTGGAWAGLAEGGPKLSGRRARRLLEQRLGQPLERLFGAFEDLGCAASMAQVHRAWLRDGRQVAVKLLLPGLRQRIDAGGALSRYLLGRLQGRARGYDMLAMEGEIHRLSLAECDLEAEAAWLRHFEAWQASFPWFELPVPIPQACGPETLTMTWMEGARLHEAATWTRAERALAGARLVRLFLEGALVDGCLHADPNPGNLRLRRLGQGEVAVGLLDFGCVLTLPQGFSGAFASLLESLRAGSLTGEDALRHLQAMGFDRAPLEAAKLRLPEGLAVLFAPFLVDGAYDPQAWDLRRRFREALGPQAQAFRAAAPASLLYFVRAYAGLVAQVQALDARFHWQAPLAEALGSARRQRVPRADLPPTPDYGAAQSTWLRIEVQKAGSVAVDLSFPAACAGRLGELMPLDLAARIAERGEDLDEHSRRAAEGGFAPGELYRLQDPDKTVRIWLE
jgi:hypothetical protein